MSDDKSLDIKKVIEQGTQRMTLRDLAQQGFENVKVLDEEAVHAMITQAVDRVVTNQTAEQRESLLEESRRELDRLLREHKAMRSRAQLLEADKHELIEQVEAMQRELQLKGELEEETVHKKIQEGLSSLQSQVAELRRRYQAATQDLDAARAEASRLRDERARLESDAEDARSRLDAIKGTHEAALAEVAELQREVARLTADRDRVEKEGESALARVESLEKQLAEQEVRARGAEKARTDVVAQVLKLQARLDEAQKKSSGDADRLRAEVARLAEEERAARARLEKATAEADRFRDEVSRLKDEVARGQEAARSATEDRERLGAAKAALEKELALRRDEASRLGESLREDAARRARLAELEALIAVAEKERDARGADLARAESEGEKAREDLESARQEAAFLRGQLAHYQKESETAREKTVIVTAELQEIEERQKEEKSEFERLRDESARLREENDRTGREIESARSEIQALQDLLTREQEAARVAQNEAATLQDRLSDFQARSVSVEREVQSLRVENARLQERLATAHLQERLAGLESLLDAARRSSSEAKASAVESKAVTAQLRSTLAGQNRPKLRTAGAPLLRGGGAAFDGMALLDGFIRKIRLKEHFQRYVPVQERPGKRHPSEMLVEVVKAIVAGERPRGAAGDVPPLEIVGPSGGPDIESLRQFLGGLSPQAVRAIAGVHHALRLHLTPLPGRPHPLALDVVAIELGKRGRSYRPLLGFDPATGEFWSGQFRPNRAPDADGVRDFVKACVARVPAPFARDRIRFRMESEFFNEGVIRLLESRRVSYVMAAPDVPAVRKRSRACAFQKLQNGWEVGEFSQRLHPIRRTQARFVVLRRRLSKAAAVAGRGTFRDERHVYHVFATDRRATPWRSFEFYSARPSSVERARALLSEFSTSPLLGRSRRSVAALFQAHLLASDLVQWFRRSCLPEEERRDLPELRSTLLMVPPKSGAPGTRTLIVLPKRDPRRRLFGRVARLTGRVRPARPFRFRP